MAWVGFEPMTIEFHSDTLTDWAIRPWVQLTLRANFVQLLQFHRLFRLTFHFGYCLILTIYACMDNNKVWVSCKMQSRFQEKMCLVYQKQNCLLLRPRKADNLNLLFYYHNCFFWIVSRNYFKKKCSSNLAVVYREGFEGWYSGVGT